MLEDHTNPQAPTLILQHKQTPTYNPVQLAVCCRLGRNRESRGACGKCASRSLSILS